MKPILSNERVGLLDILRGLAIFGMFTVNMTVDNVWAGNFRDLDLPAIDFVALVFVDLFTKGKFITIFSFLFGIGFLVQMERAEARGINKTSFYIRRSTGLFFIGVLGMACTINTWILVDYAVVGLGLLLFYKRPPRTILITGVALILVGNIFGWIIPEYLELSREAVPAAEQISSPSSQATSQPETPDENVFRDGDFKQISLHWLQMLWDAFTDWRYYASEVRLLGVMLLGLYVARRGAVWDPSARRSLAKKSLPWLIAAGFAGCLVWVVMADFAKIDESSIYMVFGHIAAWPIGMTMLGLGYAAAITLLMDHKSWQRRLAPFAVVGRTALSNYLVTAFVGAFIGSSWGLGLYAQVPVSMSLLLVLIVFSVQILASHWWMARFRFGPAEWLWRSFTYGKLQPMRRAGT
jgi:uncharacterized protein